MMQKAMNYTFSQWHALQYVGEFGGSGVTIGLVIAIMIFSKREDNRTIAGISLVPGLFNINETRYIWYPNGIKPNLQVFHLYSHQLLL